MAGRLRASCVRRLKRVAWLGLAARGSAARVVVPPGLYDAGSVSPKRRVPGWRLGRLAGRRGTRQTHGTHDLQGTGGFRAWLRGKSGRKPEPGSQSRCRRSYVPASASTILLLPGPGDFARRNFLLRPEESRFVGAGAAGRWWLGARRGFVLVSSAGRAWIAVIVKGAFA